MGKTLKNMETPVLFLVFNRLDTTKRVFEAIRQVRPPKLFIAADGPRADRAGEAESCDALRQFIINNIDWECEVKTLFRDRNLGCRNAVSSAVDWFFENVEEGIILEDDCLPHQDFFRFCQGMLEYYRDDKRIMHIGGGNFQLGNKRGNGSYYFSRHAHIWGWASWRRAWHDYDVNMKSFPDFKKQNVIANIFPDKKVQRRWLEILDKIYTGDPVFNTWDFQWNYALFCQNGLSVIPNVNLISNIGCGVDSTNTSTGNIFSELKIFEMDSIIKPEFVMPDKIADDLTFYNFFRNSIAGKLKTVMSRILK